MASTLASFMNRITRLWTSVSMMTSWNPIPPISCLMEQRPSLAPLQILLAGQRGELVRNDLDAPRLALCAVRGEHLPGHRPFVSRTERALWVIGHHRVSGTCSAKVMRLPGALRGDDDPLLCCRSCRISDIQHSNQAARAKLPGTAQDSP